MTIFDILSFFLAAAFVLSGWLNLTGPDFVRADYAKWGYPDVLRIAVGGSGILAASLLIWEPGRVWGAALATIILIGAIGSLVRTREWLRLEYPILLTGLVVLVGWHVLGGMPAGTRL